MIPQRLSYNSDLTAYTRCLLNCYKHELETFGRQIQDLPSVERICSLLAQYVVAPSGKNIAANLMIAGGVGSGKSTLLRALTETMGWDAEYDFATRQKRAERLLNLTILLNARQLVQQVQDCGEFPNLYVDYPYFLIIDDVGSEEPMVKCYGTTMRVIEDIICMRADRGLRTVISTNYDREALGRYYHSERVADRLKDYALIELNSNSYRGK